jgi:hypothetical protein
MGIRRWNRSGLMMLAVLVLLAVPALAQDVITRGTDPWYTAPDGSSYTDLNLPAGFLDKDCSGYQGHVVLAGVPVEAKPADAYYYGDTLVERLEDAVFDANGVAKVKIVVRGLHFKGADALKTDCGEWSADVGLAKEQTPTEMTIVRENENGGYFTAPISVDTVWTFTRSSDGAVRTLNTSNILTSDEKSPWQAGTCTKAAAVTRKPALINATNHGKPSLKIAAISRGFNPGFGPNCLPNVLCRGKQIDPSIHCYSPAIANFNNSAQ